MRSTETTAAADVLGKLGLSDISIVDGQVSAGLGEHAPEKINVELVRAGVPVAGLEKVRPSLEDLFVEPTGEGFDVNG